MKTRSGRFDALGETRYYDGTIAQVGDTVRCVDANASFHRLTLGATYKVSVAYDGSPVVIVDRAYHSVDRFVPEVRS